MESQKVVFQASVYSTLALSALILAHAEGAAFPQGVTLPLALVSWIFIERGGTFRLPTWAANALGMTGFVAAMAELLSNSLEARLLSGAHLLVYLSWVVLLQQKEARQYLWMLALSMLQVAVGAVLTTSETYGCLVALYFCMAIWTLSLFTLWRSTERLQASEQGRSTSPVDGRTGAAPEERPFASLFAVSGATGGVQRDGQGRLSLRRFFRGTMATSFACLVVAGAFFALIPRVWVGAPLFGAEAAAPAALSVTGFTGEVTLGDIGRILESNEPALTISLYDNDSRKAIPVEEYAEKMGWDEPLFRGAVLARYENGQWRSRQTTLTVTLRAAPPTGARRVRQEITMMPIKTNALLAMAPIAECRSGGQGVGYFPVTGVAQRSSPMERTQFSYTVYSPHPEDKSVLGYVPLSAIAARIPSLAIDIRKTYLEIPARLERLAAEARRVAGVAGDEERPSDAEMAQRLVRHLRDSGQFSYSLDASVKNENLDPIEDFLLERKQGHCEYFASSLALMLRAVDIPSRLVSGFKGGTLNSITGGFDVQQRHAHAWVEALIDDRWVTLDATPSAPREEVVAALNPGLPKITEILNFLRDGWNAYVLNMSLSHQNDRIFAPAKQAARSIWESIRGNEREQANLIGAIRRFLSNPSEWFSWKGGLATLLLGALASGLYWTSKVALRAMRQWTGLRNDTRAAHERTIAFYERFRLLCARHGLERDPAQTQREFGEAVASAWCADAASTTGVPALLAELFYRVRFGDRELSETEAADVATALDQLEQALTARAVGQLA